MPRSSVLARACGALGLGAVLSATTFAGVGGASPSQGAPTYTVDSTADAVDVLPGDRACRTWSGRCTLRAAVMEANASGGGSIVLPAGRVELSIAPGLLDRALQVAPVLGDDRGGDLDLKVPITIRGAGASRTTVDANGLHRVFQVQPLAQVGISDVSLTGGRVDGTFGDGILEYSGGGAIWNASTLRLTRVTVTDNEAGFGGGVFNDPFSDATFTDSTIADNRAGEAGGVRCDASCVFTDTTISDNVVEDPQDPTRPGSLSGTGGGVDIRGVLPVSFVGSRITGNSAVHGGGVNAGPGYVDSFPDPQVPIGTSVSFRDTVISGNTSTAGGGSCRAQAARLVDLGGNTDGDGSCLG